MRDQIKDIIEVVGMIAIVASLVVLALEVRQNTTALEAGAWQVRSDALMNLSLQIAGSRDLAEVQANLLQRPEGCAEDDPSCTEINATHVQSLNAIQHEQYRAYLRAHAFRLQNMVVQYEYGLLTDDYYERGVIGAIKMFTPRWRAFDVPQGMRLSTYVEEFERRVER
jgi:hypothetical protein